MWFLIYLFVECIYQPQSKKRVCNVCKRLGGEVLSSPQYCFINLQYYTHTSAQVPRLTGKRALKKNFPKNFLRSFLAVTAKVVCRWGPVLQVDEDASNYLHKKSCCLAQLGYVRWEKREAGKDFNTYSCSTKGSLMNCVAQWWKKKKKLLQLIHCVSLLWQPGRTMNAPGENHTLSRRNRALAWQLTVNWRMYLITSSKPLETCIIDGAPKSLSH